MAARKFMVMALLLVSFCFGISPFAQIPTEIDSLERALRVAGDDTSRVNILNLLGSILRYNTSDTKGLTYEHQAIVLGKKAGFTKGVARAYRNLGYIYVNLGDLTTALAYFDTCITYSRNKGYRRGEAMGHNGIGWTYTDMGRSSEGISQYRQGLAIYAELGDSGAMQDVHIYMGNNFYVTGFYSDAMDQYMQCLRLAEKRGDADGMGDAYFGMALVLGAQQNQSEALGYYRKILDLCGTGDDLETGYVYNNMGTLYKEMGDYSEALHYLGESRRIKSLHGDEAGVASIQVNIGDVLFLYGRYREALDTLIAARKVHRKFNRWIEIAGVEVSIGKVMLEECLANQAGPDEESLQEARRALESGLTSALLVRDRSLISLSYLFLSRADSAKGNYREALQHMKLYITYRDSLFSEESRNRIQQIRLGYETEKRDREIALLEGEKILKEEQLALLHARNRLNTGIMIAAVAGVVLLLAVVFFIIRNRRKLNKAYNLVSRQKERITEVLTELEATNLKLETSNLKLADTNLKLADANQELEAFSYSVSHDLRAPVRRIEGLCEMLGEDYEKLLDDAGKDLLARITGSTVLMNTLIEDMLKLSRITRQLVTKAPCNISEMAKMICEDVRLNYPGKEVTCRIQDGIIVEADEHLMQIAMQNLIDNAFKYSSKVERPEVSLNGNMQDGKMVISVRDNGVGFEMSQAGKLFTPFQRLHSDEEFKGTGIGLATVKRIIVKHGGTISVESKPGKGTTFSYTLG